MSRYARELAYTLIVAGAFLGFALGAAGALLARVEITSLLWKACLSGLFGGFLMRIFVSVAIANIRQAKLETTAESVIPSDIDNRSKGDATAPS